MTTRRVLFLLYDGFELLDLAGPSSVFNTANALARRPLYAVTVAADVPRVPSGSGVTVEAGALDPLSFGLSDTLLVPGAEESPLRRAQAAGAIASTLNRAHGRVERLGSVCTGAFLLAAAGLLKGRKAATHWAGCGQFADLFPDVDLQADALYVEDGPFWTSAGVTTGLDMALAMVARDHGAALMGEVAKYLVVYAHRPGRQSQFSSLIEAQTRADGAFADLIDWLLGRLDEPITVLQMAERAGMSERTFARKFAAATGSSPKRFVEAMRMDHARLALEAGEPIKCVAPRVGFRSEAAFRAAFSAALGVPPSHYARMHRRGTEPPES